MTRTHVQTVIIGAGPAGMGVAITLVKRGARVCVIDKAKFPRDKTCAGLVTAKTYRLIEELYGGKPPESLFCARAESVRLFDRTTPLTDSTLDRPVRLVDRRDFDHALVKEYGRSGGVLLEGERAERIDYERCTVTTQSGRTLGYDYLLFADGARSLAHRQLKVDYRKSGIGIETYLPARLLDAGSIDLYFGYLDSGYLWVFPHGDRVCVGAAAPYRKGFDYRGLLSRFLTDLGAAPQGLRYIGAFLPYGEAVSQEKLPDNVMLLGDAAGFTDPISLEGLYMALRSGIFAAQALLTDTVKKTYLDSIAPLRQIVKDGKKVQKAFYAKPVQRMFLNKVKGKDDLVSFFFENMVEDYHYAYRDLRRMLDDYRSR